MPDVVTVDLRLPDMGGAAAARILKDDARTATVLVAVSALSLEGSDDWLEATGLAGADEKRDLRSRVPR